MEKRCAIETLRSERTLGVVVAVIAAILLLTAPLLALQVEEYTNYMPRGTEVAFGEPWQMDVDGIEKTADFPLKVEKDTQEVILKNRFPEVADNMMLIFYRQWQHITVEVEGRQVYEMSLGKVGDRESILGAAIVCVPVFSNYSNKEVVVRMQKLEGKNFRLDNLRLGTMEGLVSWVVNKNRLALVFIFLMGCGVMVSLGLAVFAKSRQGGWITERHLFVHLAIFMLNTALWIMTDTGLWGVVFWQPVVGSILTYVSFALLPLLFANLMLAMQIGQPRFVQIMRWVALANPIVQLMVYRLGLLDLPNMLSVTHGMILVLGLGLIVPLFRDTVTEKKTNKRLLAAGSIIMGGFAVIGIAMYFISGGDSYMVVAYSALVVFSIAILINSIFILSDNIQQQSDEDNQEKMAYIDGVTGLGNRRAFEHDLFKASEAKGHEDTLLVMMDTEGSTSETGNISNDEMLEIITTCVKDIFKDTGTCYRIGRDTFAAILPGWTGNTAAYQRELVQMMEERGKEQHCKLPIVWSVSHLLDEKGEKKNVSQWRREAEMMINSDKAENGVGSMWVRNADYLSVLECVVSQSESKLLGMERHSDHVKELTAVILDILKISGQERDEILTAAKFHDVGIIGTPDEVSNKPDRLSEEELRLLHRHVELGDAIFARVAGMQRVGSMVRSHHERYDGKGYPDHLQGEQIPYGARVIAIADALDAITSSRSYREAGGVEYCCRQLEKNMGSMFDPEIGSKLLDEWDAVENILKIHIQQKTAEQHLQNNE